MDDLPLTSAICVDIPGTWYGSSFETRALEMYRSEFYSCMAPLMVYMIELAYLNAGMTETGNISNRHRRKIFVCFARG